MLRWKATREKAGLYVSAQVLKEACSSCRCSIQIFATWQHQKTCVYTVCYHLMDWLMVSFTCLTHAVNPVGCDDKCRSNTGMFLLCVCVVKLQGRKKNTWRQFCVKYLHTQFEKAWVNQWWDLEGSHLAFFSRWETFESSVLRVGFHSL